MEIMAEILEFAIWILPQVPRIQISKPYMPGSTELKFRDLRSSVHSESSSRTLLISPSFLLSLCIRIISRRTLGVGTASTSCSL